VSTEHELHQRRSEILARMRADRATAALLESLTPPPAALPVVEQEQSLFHTTVMPASPLSSDDGEPSTTPGGTPATETARSATAPTQRALSVGFAGRLVRADEVNLNGAYFSREDLDFGLASLMMAPATYNHVGDGAIGYITEAKTMETADHGYHIDIRGRLWTARFPFVADSLETTMAAGQAALSMECVASAVGCMTEGCMTVATEFEEACEHIAQRTGPRRMIRPTFYGAALILDGIKPGWPGASLARD
jgi:hypothetical protein